jgi:hypothetical protein
MSRRDAMKMRRVSWRDREYARLREDERRALFGATRSAGRPTRRTSGTPTLLFAVGLSSIAVLAGHRYLRLPIHLSSAAPTQTAASPSVPSAALNTPDPRSRVVSIHWSRPDIAPAASAGRICVTMSEHGRVCATYVAGEKPADTLTRRLASLGLHVQSSG